ncbi:MAG: hypothetical protein MJH11_20730, partial [Lentisphaeria bacterium]|nr:hypothetical protein [Lentisphaeria bacterium]
TGIDQTTQMSMPSSDATQAMTKGPLFGLKLTEVYLQKSQLWIFIGCLSLALLIPLFMGLMNYFICFVIALITSTALPRLVARVNLPPLKTAAVFYGILIVGYIFVLIPLYNLWIRNSNSFYTSLNVIAQKLDEGINKGKKLVNENVSGGKKAKKLEAGSDAKEMTDKGTSAISNTLTLTPSTRLKLLVQLILLSGFFSFLPVLLMSQLDPKLANAPPEEKLSVGQAICAYGLQAFDGIGKVSIVRVVKALLITFLCGGAMMFSGLKGWLFVACIVGLVALICNLSPIVAGILAALMVPGADNWIIGIIGAALTFLLLGITERKLHWYFKLVPMSKRYNVPPEMLNQKQQSSGMQTIGRIISFIPSLISLAVFAALIWAGYSIYQIYGVKSERDREIKKVEKYKGTKKRIKGYEGILETNPDYLPLYDELLKAHLVRRQYKEALLYAEKIYDWSSDAVGADAAFRSLADDASVNRSIPKIKGYEQLIKNFTGGVNNAGFIARSLAQREEDSAFASLLMAKAHLKDGNTKQAMEFAQEAIERDKESGALGASGKLSLLYQLAEHYLENSECTKAKGTIEDCEELADDYENKLEELKIKLTQCDEAGGGDDGDDEAGGEDGDGEEEDE